MPSPQGESLGWGSPVDTVPPQWDNMGGGKGPALFPLSWERMCPNFPMLDLVFLS